MRVSTLATAAVLMGCATFNSPEIYDLEEDKVVIRIGASYADTSSVERMARRGCAVHDRTPVLISEFCDEYGDPFCWAWKYYLFACKSGR